LSALIDNDALKTTLTGSTAEEAGTPPEQIVAIGGRYDETPRSLSDGEHAQIALTPEGRILVEFMAQTFQIVVNQTVSAGATLTSGWIEGNGYNAVGIFVDFAPGELAPWSYRLHVSPNKNSWTHHPDTVMAVEKLGRPIALLHTIGHARWLRFAFTNRDESDIQGLNVWFQLVF